MQHIFFFSYASKNLDSELKEFFEQLCADLAPLTKWAAEEPNISFRDGTSLPLMGQWREDLLEALQHSGVLVCVTSNAYFNSAYCGKEYFIFNERRRQPAGSRGAIPRVVLPVIWAPADPIDTKAPILDEIQFKIGQFPPTYVKNGLRHLMISDRQAYRKIVLEFAHAIHAAWKQHASIPPLAGVQPFDQIPNSFAGGKWQEAAGPAGWLPGPGIANFVFAADRSAHLKQPPGRYGASGSAWRPFLPPEGRTVADIAETIAHRQQLKYREIVLNDTIGPELTAALERKNLTVVVADPQTLPLPDYTADYKEVAAFDATHPGTSLMILWDGVAGPWPNASQQVSQMFPGRSQLAAPTYLAPIGSAADFEQQLDVTLADLRVELTRTETLKKQATDTAPAQISATSGASV